MDRNEYPPFHKTILINASASAVWQALTTPALMQQWMSETPIQINTSWQVGSPFSISGPWYKTSFENAGQVLQFETEHILSYSHLSSLSRLPNEPDNYCIFSFQLNSEGEQTTLSFTASNFVTEAIYRHIVFYWNVVLELLKKHIEKPLS